MKSERMKTSGMGRGAGGKESEIVLGFMGGGVFFGERDGKILYYLVAFVFLQGEKKTTKTGRNEERRGCDFANI